MSLAQTRAPRICAARHRSGFRSGSALFAITILALALPGCALPIGSSPPAHTSATARQQRLYATTYSAPPKGSTALPTLSINSLDPASGATQWRVGQASAIPTHVAMPVASGDMVFAMSDVIPATAGPGSELSGVLSAFQASDGAPRWQAKLGAFIATPLIANGVLYTTAVQYDSQGAQVKWVYALRAVDGATQWKVQTPIGGGQNDSITLMDGVLYIASNEFCFDYCHAAYLFAVRTSDGKLLWNDTISGNLNISPPTVDHGVVLLTYPSLEASAYGQQTEMAAYDAASGALLWSRVLYTPPTFSQSSTGQLVVADSSVVYAGVATPLPSDPSNPEHWTYALAAWNDHTGTLNWQVPTGLYPFIVAHDAQTLYVQSQNTLAAYLRATGHEQWHANEPVSATVLGLQNGMLFGAAYASGSSASLQLVALRASDGVQRWQTALSPGAVASVEVPYLDTETFYALTSDALYVVVNGETLFAVAPTDGHILWRQTFGADMGVIDLQATT